MGKWATYQRRGGTRTTPVETPVLSAVDPDDLSWVYASPDPDGWQVDSANSPTGPWTLDTTETGDRRTSDDHTTGLWYSVFGVDTLGNPVTPRSNAVLLP